MKTIACPVEGDHGTDCLCNGSRELITRPKTSLCPKCGDPADQRNLGFIANQMGRYVGMPCTDCGTVGDVAEFERRKAAADALRGPDEIPASSEFARAVGGNRAAPAPPAPQPPADQANPDDALMQMLRNQGLCTRAAADATLADVSRSRSEATAELAAATSREERMRVLVWLDDLDRAERIANRIIAEVG